MEPIAERLDTVYYEASASFEALVAGQPDTSIQERLEPEVSGAEKTTVFEQEKLNPDTSSSPDILLAENPVPLSRVGSLVAKVKMAAENFKPLSRKPTMQYVDRPDSKKPSTHSRHSSLGGNKGEITERLVPTLDETFIENWDKRTGAIVTFKNDTEGFKLLPKGVAEMEDYYFTEAVRKMLPEWKYGPIKSVRRIANFIDKGHHRRSSYKA